MRTSRKLEGDGQVLLDEFIHLPLNLALLLSVGLVVEDIRYLTLLSLDMSIARTLTTKHPHHQLIKQMLGRVGRRELVLVVIV